MDWGYACCFVLPTFGLLRTMAGKTNAVPLVRESTHHHVRTPTERVGQRLSDLLAVAPARLRKGRGAADFQNAGNPQGALIGAVAVVGHIQRPQGDHSFGQNHRQRDRGHLRERPRLHGGAKAIRLFGRLLSPRHLQSEPLRLGAATARKCARIGPQIAPANRCIASSLLHTPRHEAPETAEGARPRSPRWHSATDAWPWHHPPHGTRRLAESLLSNPYTPPPSPAKGAAVPRFHGMTFLSPPTV